MTDQVLNILKFVLLGLLYLFFARVLWAVWSEVRTPSRRPVPRAGAMAAAPTVPTGRPVAAPAPAPKPKRGKRRGKEKGRPRAGRLVILGLNEQTVIDADVFELKAAWQGTFDW